MYRYKIGYWSHEDSFFVELEHDKKFTEEDLTGMICEAIIWVVRELAKRDVYIHNFSDAMMPHCSQPHDIIIDVPTFLVKQRGFRATQYEADWSVFGWPSLFHKDDWGEQRTDRLNDITDFINATGLGKSFDEMVRGEEEGSDA